MDLSVVVLIGNFIDEHTQVHDYIHFFLTSMHFKACVALPRRNPEENVGMQLREEVHKAPILELKINLVTLDFFSLKDKWNWHLIQDVLYFLELHKINYVEIIVEVEMGSY